MSAPFQLFVDMDGVLADFDRGYGERFEERASKLTDNVDWEAVRSTPGFFRDLPPMADLGELWAGVERFKPIILTGVPSSVPEAVENKRAWVAKHLGPDIHVIGCRSSDKCLHGKPGDVLIDDWTKYQRKWVSMGGHWITHTSAAESLDQLAHFVEPGTARNSVKLSGGRS